MANLLNVAKIHSIQTLHDQGWSQRRMNQPDDLVLCGNYGEKIHRRFRMTRQGVRWRFQRIMDMYISSFESILFVEKHLGSQLRHDAVAISRQRYELRQRVPTATFQRADGPNVKSQRDPTFSR